MSGWRYRGRPRLPVTIAVGLFSGFGGGAVQIAGPAVIIYWLGGDNAAAKVRANLLVYFLLTDVMLCVSYFWQDLFTADVIALALLLAGPFFVATAAGACFLSRAHPSCSIAGSPMPSSRRRPLLSLPLLDRWLR